MHPYTKDIKRIFSCKSDDELDAVKYGVINPSFSRQPFERGDGITDEQRIAYTTSFYLGLEVKLAPCKLRTISQLGEVLISSYCRVLEDPRTESDRQIDISHAITDFIAALKDWKLFDAKSMFVFVSYKIR